MSHQFDLFPPPPPRKERGVSTLVFHYPWSNMVVFYKLDELGLRAWRILGPVETIKVSKSSKRRFSASKLRLHGEPESGPRPPPELP